MISRIVTYHCNDFNVGSTLQLSPLLLLRSLNVLVHQQCFTVKLTAGQLHGTKELAAVTFHMMQ